MATVKSSSKSIEKRREAARVALMGHISVRSLARKMDMHPSTVSRILRGERGVTLRVGQEMALALGVDMETLASYLGALTRLYPKPKPREGAWSK